MKEIAQRLMLAAALTLVAFTLASLGPRAASRRRSSARHPASAEASGCASVQRKTIGFEPCSTK